ncbi:hypothetical protein OHV05_30840 [Kitasatospora sp. NBC_00070]|uniref:hypothetical protein n=1 Tax=Kitasatospora sp. NBC_00070 TaxID=2975962 RepID=UPI0032455D8A
MRRTIGLAVASVLLGAGAAVAVPAAAQAAPGSAPSAAPASYSWQYTGEYYSAKSACTARASFYLAASNVKYYRCISESGLWAGQVYAN